MGKRTQIHTDCAEWNKDALKINHMLFIYTGQELELKREETVRT